MADPLSIAAGVIGVVTAATQITSLLIRFTEANKNAPAQVRYIVTEVTDIHSIILQLQSYIDSREGADSSRTSLLKIDQLVAILSGCVLTFSELEKLLDEMKVEDMAILDRVKWVRKETEILGLVQRLQNHKASLSLMLNIMNGFAITIRPELFQC